MNQKLIKPLFDGRTSRMPLMFLLYLCLWGFAQCSSDDSSLCDAGDAIALESNTCLLIEHQNLTDAQQNQVVQQITQAVAMVNNLMEVENLSIIVVDDPNLVITEIGIGGFNPSQSEVIISIDENFANFDISIDDELIPLVAHEIHHAKRRRTVGYGDSLIEAIITEGLADHFSMQVVNIDPPMWSVALSEIELEQWIENASSQWDDPYDHGQWFLGTSNEIPRWTGYSIGYKLVADYLNENTDSSPSNLHDEPASSFQP
jgi:uncharacterized protein YjaZ